MEIETYTGKITMRPDAPIKMRKPSTFAIRIYLIEKVWKKQGPNHIPTRAFSCTKLKFQEATLHMIALQMMNSAIFKELFGQMIGYGRLRRMQDELLIELKMVMKHR